MVFHFCVICVYPRQNLSLHIFISKLECLYAFTTFHSPISHRSCGADAADRAWCFTGTGQMAGGAILRCALQAQPDARKDVAGAQGPHGDPSKGRTAHEATRNTAREATRRSAFPTADASETFQPV